MTTDTDAIWAAVHKLIRPTRQRLERASSGEWLTEVEEATDGVCYVAAHRYATATYATIPSLWEQATLALEGGEVQPGRGSKPLRERSIADLDLMEIRAIIRDTTRHELEKRAVKTPRAKDGSPKPFHPDEISTLANLVTREGPDGKAGDWPKGLDFWAYRFTQWGRLLETYLHAQEHQARPVRLRNSACPNCSTRQVTTDVDGEELVVPALVVEFRDGYVRAARCDACGEAWFRGPDLERLAAELGVKPLADTPNSAAC